jgi:hypothetical protein
MEESFFIVLLYRRFSMNKSVLRATAQIALAASLLAAGFGASAKEISVRDQQYTVTLFNKNATLEPFETDFTPVTGKGFDGAGLINFGNTSSTGASGQYQPDTRFALNPTYNKFGQTASYYSTGGGLSFYAFVTDAKETNATNVNKLHFVNFDLADANAHNQQSMNTNPDVYFQNASNMNDQGQFFAYGGGNRYLISPVPEPTTMVLMLAGLGLVGAAARRQLKSKSL